MSAYNQKPLYYNKHQAEKVATTPSERHQCLWIDIRTNDRCWRMVDPQYDYCFGHFQKAKQMGVA